MCVSYKAFPIFVITPTTKAFPIKKALFESETSGCFVKFFGNSFNNSSSTGVSLLCLFPDLTTCLNLLGCLPPSLVIIVREGFEVVLFYAALFATGVQSINAVVFGAVIGFVALIASYYGLRRLTKIIPIGMFFRASAVFLLIMSAYFGYEGVHELVEGLEDLKVL